MFKPFSRLPKIFKPKEATWVFLIIAFIISAISINLLVSERKGRDAQRKQDIRSIYDALEKYHTDFGSYPASENGRIVACDSGSKNELGQPILKACDWGLESLRDVGDLSYPVYLERIPSDPSNRSGRAYQYLSDTKYFQMYASLEGHDEAEFDTRIVSRNLGCGVAICNFGFASGATPLDKSIEEYENELLQLRGR